MNVHLDDCVAVSFNKLDFIIYILIVDIMFWLFTDILNH